MILASQNVEVPGGVSDVRLDTKERQREGRAQDHEAGRQAGKRFTGFLQKPCNFRTKEIRLYLRVTGNLEDALLVVGEAI